MDRQERNDVFRSPCAIARAERRDLLLRLARRQRTLVRRLETEIDGRALFVAPNMARAALKDTLDMAREIAEGLERIGDVQ